MGKTILIIIGLVYSFAAWGVEGDPDADEYNIKGPALKAPAAPPDMSRDAWTPDPTPAEQPQAPADTTKNSSGAAGGTSPQKDDMSHLSVATLAADSGIPKVEAVKSSCVRAAKAADKDCVLGSSQVGAAVTPLMTMGAAAMPFMSAGLMCSQYNMLMRNAQMLMGAYNMSCAPSQKACTSSCEEASQAVGKIILDICPDPLKTSLTPEEQRTCAALAKTSKNIDAVKTNTCGYSGLTLSSGLSSFATTMAQSAMGAVCAAQLGGTGLAGLAALAPLNCAGKDAANPTCICQANPRSPGCGVPDTSGSSYGSAPLTDNNPVTDKGPTGMPLIPDSGGTGGFTPTGTGASMASLGSPGGGGGGAGLGGLSGSSKMPASSSGSGAAAGRSGVNTNVLGGEGGGGGGPRGGGGGGGWADGNSAYKAFMPGGAKDPSRKLASDSGKEITGGGGKSNWEKVHERYRDARPTLINK